MRPTHVLCCAIFAILSVGRVCGEDDTVAKETLSLLPTRIGEYHKAVQRHKYKKIVALWAPESRDPQDESDMRHFLEEGEGQGVQLEKWCIKDAYILGSTVKVIVWVTGKARSGPSSWEPLEGPEDEYWKWEHGSWYFLPGNPTWDEANAKSISLESGTCDGS